MVGTTDLTVDVPEDVILKAVGFFNRYIRVKEFKSKDSSLLSFSERVVLPWKL